MLTSGCTCRNQGTTPAFGLIGLRRPEVGPCGTGWSTPCLLCTHPVHVCRVLPCWIQCGWIQNGRENSGHLPRGGKSFGDCLSLVALVGCVTSCPSWAWLLLALGGYVPSCPGWACACFQLVDRMSYIFFLGGLPAFGTVWSPESVCMVNVEPDDV